MNIKIKKKHRAFTIVELVIVIAVIGILSAILIPTFVGIIDKANLSSDQALVKNLNTTLAMDEVEYGKKTTMHDVVTTMKQDYGYDLTIISVKSSDSTIVWDSVHNRFVLVTTTDGNTSYFTGSDEYKYNDSYLNNLWKIYPNANELPLQKNQTYSIYLSDNDYASEINVSVGFDAGNNSNITTVNYVTGSGKRNSIIRTNGSDLTIDAPNDTVTHYGLAKNLTITAIDNNSYYEYGEILNFVSIESGHFVAKNSATFHQDIDNIQALFDKEGVELTLDKGSQFNYHESGDWTIITEPTCTEAGEREKSCICGTATIHESISPLGHDYDNGTEQEVECTGTSIVYTCKRCGVTKLEQSDDYAEKHTLVIIPGFDPTCTSNGLTEGQKCENCDHIIVEQTIIPATGHSYASNPSVTYNWNNERTLCTAIVTHNCESCDHTETEIKYSKLVNTNGGNTTPATCIENGSIVYDITAIFDDSSLSSVVHRVEEIPALGHKYSETNTAWSNNYTTCEITLTCSNCGDVFTTTPTIINSAQNDDGTTTYTATYSVEDETRTTSVTVETQLEEEYKLIKGVFCYGYGNDTNTYKAYDDDYTDSDTGITYTFENGNLVLEDYVLTEEHYSSNYWNGLDYEIDNITYHHTICFPGENWKDTLKEIDNELSQIYNEVLRLSDELRELYKQNPYNENEVKSKVTEIVNKNSEISNAIEKIPTQYTISENSKKYLTTEMVVYFTGYVGLDSNLYKINNDYYSLAYNQSIYNIFNYNLGSPNWIYGNPGDTITTTIKSPAEYLFDIDFSTLDKDNMSGIFTASWTEDDVQKYIDTLHSEYGKETANAIPNLIKNTSFLNYLNSSEFLSSIKDGSVDTSSTDELTYYYTQHYNDESFYTYSQYLQDNYYGENFTNFTYADAVDLISSNSGVAISYNNEYLKQVEPEVIELILKSYYTYSYYKTGFSKNSNFIKYEGYDSINSNSDSIFTFNYYDMKAYIFMPCPNNYFNGVDIISPHFKCIFKSDYLTSINN